MILEDMFNGRYYPSEKVVPETERYIQANREVSKILARLSERLSKEDMELVERMHELISIADNETGVCYFKYGFASGAIMMLDIYAEIMR